MQWHHRPNKRRKPPEYYLGDIVGKEPEPMRPVYRQRRDADWVQGWTHVIVAAVAFLTAVALLIAFLVLLFLYAAQPSLASEQLIRVPLSCRVLGVLNGIDVPAKATIEEARAGLAQAEQRADASLPGVRLCLHAARRAISNAESK